MQFKPCMVFRKAALAALLAWPSLASAVKVGVINVAPSGSQVRVKVATESKVEPQVSVLEGDKVLIVVPQGQRSLNPLKVRAGIVKGIRFGSEAGDLRIVLDLIASGSAVLGAVNEKGFEVMISPSGTVGAAPAEKADAEVGNLNPANVSYTYRVVDLFLGGSREQGELVISCDGPASYKSSLKENGKLLSLSFRNSSLAWSGDGARLSDASVSGVSVKQLSEGGESVVKVEVRLREKLAYSLKRDQNQLVLRFERPEEQADLPTKGNLQALVSLDVEDTDIIGVLKALSQQAGFEFQFTKDILSKGPPENLVTIKVTDRPFKEVVSAILAQVQADFLQQGNTLFFGSITEISERTARLPSVRRFYEPKYYSLTQLKNLLDKHFSRGNDVRLLTSYFADPKNSSQFMIVATAQDASEILAAMATYDVPESGEQSASTGGESGGSQPKTQVFKLQYLDSTHQPLIFAAILQLYPEGETVPTPYLDPATRTLVVTTPVKYLTKIERLLARLDVKPAQVNIEGKIVEVNQGFAQQLGINWSANQVQASPQANLTLDPSVPTSFPAQLTYATLQNGFNINARLQAAVNERNAELVSSPNITTNDNVAATISTNDTDISVQSTTVVGVAGTTQTNTFVTNSIPLSLAVLPKISMADKRINLQINFDLTTASGAPVVTGAPVPTSSQRAVTNVNVSSGDTAVIGGLVRQINIETERKVPLLGDIPLLGLLFKFNSTSKDKKEVIIFITPTIVED